jgi:serine/threonine-protein kinase HSL1 (negative regulator of Swe1 kinase)
MEYVEGGELFQYIEEQQMLREIEVVYLFRQIIALLSPSQHPPPRPQA